MNIRPRVMLLLTLVFVALSGVAFAIQELAVMPSFARLEEANARTAMHRVRHAVERTLDALEVNATDWANWGDIYRFVQDHNPGFVATNVTPSAMDQLRIGTMLIVDRDGRVVMRSSDHVPTDFSLEGVLESDGMLLPAFGWRALLGTHRTARGLVRTSGGVLMLAGAPILDGTGGGEPRGMVIIGRLLTPALVQRIEAQTETTVAILPGRPQEYGDRIVADGDATRVDGAFMDVFAMPVMTLRVSVPRDITIYGHRAILAAGGSLIVATLCTFLLLLALLNRHVLAPLTRLTTHVVAVGKDPERTERLDLSADDEFGRLARAFDDMVARLAETRRDLVDQSFHAGFAEMAKGVLHNLGNALTPMGVRLSAMERRTRESPGADLELAVAELAAAGGDPERRAELLEFLALGCREVSAATQELAADIALLQRQASLMRATLSDQMRGASQNAPLFETVRLPELVAQSLDVVPDSSRRRLRLELDESVQKLGPVRVARNVLRMVLQNLIINAADAIRDAGRDSGVLRFVAAIERDGERDHLHLQCQDDGMGIEPDRLERVFEKGYSTKSRDTNHGIGLHWCANAIVGLGGRIWASSEGAGRGASLHLSIPL